MFEKPVSSALAAALKQFIQGLNEEQLNLSLWSGELLLHNVRLQPDILGHAFEGIPLCVTKGLVGTLRIAVPWTTLDSEPVVIEAEDVEIVFGPVRSTPFRTRR